MNRHLNSVIGLGAAIAVTLMHSAGAAAVSGTGTPLILNFTPASGAPGTQITIHGTNLVGITAVKINQVDASFSGFESGTTGFVVVPANSSSGFIVLETALGKVTSTTIFTVIDGAPPVVTGFSPTQGEPGMSVEIKGTNLVGAASVQFNGVQASFSVLAGLLFASVPTNATSGPITVTTAGGTSTSKGPFTITSGSIPIVASFSPAKGVPGTSVEIKGTNLHAVTEVKFDGKPATFTTLAGSLLATVPANATSGAITVTSAAGTHVTTGVFTVIQVGAPNVTGFFPAQGEPGSSVEILGENLTGVTSVSFHGVTAAFLSLSGSLRATVPSSAATGPITVVTASGTSTSSQNFIVTSGPAPVITAFSPTAGEAGATVEIRGLYLRDVTSVRFNGAEAEFTNSLFRPLSAVVPTNATTGLISVTTRGGVAVSSELFTVTNSLPPSVERISPLSGAVGTFVDIMGTNFVGIKSVLFNGTSAFFIEFTSTRLLTFVPTNAQTGPITITGVNGTITTKEVFTVIGSPAPQEPPPLSIHLIAQNQIELSWTDATGGFVLQSSDDLTPPARWVDEPAAPVSIQGRLVVSAKLAPGQKFFRLTRR